MPAILCKPVCCALLNVWMLNIELQLTLADGMVAPSSLRFVQAASWSWGSTWPSGGPRTAAASTTRGKTVPTHCHVGTISLRTLLPSLASHLLVCQWHGCATVHRRAPLSSTAHSTRRPPGRPLSLPVFWLQPFPLHLAYVAIPTNTLCSGGRNP